MERFFRFIDHPILKRAYHTFPAEAVRQAWEQRHEILDALDRLPQTFSHQDIFCRNLFSVPTPTGRQLTAIDWSFAGSAAPGAELVALINMGMGAGPIPFSEREHLTALAMDGYMQGLEDAGWHGNPDLVRYAYCVGTAYRTPIATMIGGSLDMYLSGAMVPMIEQMLGMSIEQFADRSAAAYAPCFPAFQEALRLKKVLKL